MYQKLRDGFRDLQKGMWEKQAHSMEQLNHEYKIVKANFANKIEQVWIFSVCVIIFSQKGNVIKWTLIHKDIAIAIEYELFSYLIYADLTH